MLDTDYIDYFVLYTCQESADFSYDGRDIDYQEAWFNSKRVFDHDPLTGHVLVNFTFNEAMEVNYYHKQKI